MNKLLSISLVGRPNVGKSTLFNKLAGKKLAIIDDKPGTTRDRKETIGEIGPFKFMIVDTAGLEEHDTTKLNKQMMLQTSEAIKYSDLVFFVVDANTGIKNEDRYFAKWLRKFNKKIILLANKSENFNNVKDNLNSFFELGFGEAIPISAEHKIGFNYLAEEILPYIDDNDEEDNKISPIQLAIIGRPNAGKSTLINAFLNQNRLITDPLAGTTRDVVYIDWQYKDYNFKLVDTAGIRKKTKVTDNIEKLSVFDAKKAINFSQVVIILIDATLSLDKQDLTIIDYALKEGRAVVIAINKFDLITKKNAIKKQFLEEIQFKLKSIDGVQVVFISALTKNNLEQLMDKTLQTYEMWNKRISTSILNQWIINITEDHPIPLNSKKKRPRIKYLTQNKTRPPTFLIKSNYPQDINLNYQRYLINALRRDFDFKGVPIKLLLRQSDNPYKN